MSPALVTALEAWRRADEKRFPCSLIDRSAKEVPDLAPVTSPWVPRSTSPRPPARPHGDPPEDPRPQTQTEKHHLRPRSARFEPVRHLRGVNAGSSRIPFRHARHTRTIWQYQHVMALSGLLPPSPAPPGSGCPQLHQPTAMGQRRRSLTSARSTSASRRTSGNTQQRSRRVTCSRMASVGR